MKNNKSHEQYIIDYCYEKVLKMVKENNLTTTSTTSSTSTTTSAPTQEAHNETMIFVGLNELIETISDIETEITIIIVILATMLFYKIIKICRKGYELHNEKIIQRHESTNLANL